MNPSISSFNEHVLFPDSVAVSVLYASVEMIENPEGLRGSMANTYHKPATIIDHGQCNYIRKGCCRNTNMPYDVIGFRCLQG